MTDLLKVRRKVEISNYQLEFSVDKQVFRFDVPVHNSLRVQIIETLDELSEQVADHLV